MKSSKKPRNSDNNRFSRNIVLDTLKRLRINPDSKILDLGSGDGGFTSEIRNAGYENIYACDWNEGEFLPSDVKFKKMDFSEPLNYASNTFDCVLNLEVIEHMENPWKFISEIHRITKKGGFLILTTPNADNPISRMLFLLKSRFIHFGGGNLSYELKTEKPLLDKHRTPIFDFLFKEMIYKKFRLLKIYTNGLTPKIFGKSIKLKKTSSLGMSKIYLLKK